MSSFFQNCLRAESNGIAESTPCKGVPRSRHTEASTRGGGGIGVFAENEDDGRSVARVFFRTTLASHRPELMLGTDGATIYVSSIEEIRFIEEIPSNRKQAHLLPISKRRYGCSPFFRAGVVF